MLGLAVLLRLPSTPLQDGSGELRCPGGYGGDYLRVMHHLRSVHYILVLADLSLSGLEWTLVPRSHTWIWFSLVFWGIMLVPITESHGFQSFAPYLQVLVLLWVSPLTPCPSLQKLLGRLSSTPRLGRGPVTFLSYLSNPLLPQMWQFFPPVTVWAGCQLKCGLS